MTAIYKDSLIEIRVLVLEEVKLHNLQIASVKTWIKNAELVLANRVEFDTDMYAEARRALVYLPEVLEALEIRTTRNSKIAKQNWANRKNRTKQTNESQDIRKVAKVLGVKSTKEQYIPTYQAGAQGTGKRK